MKSTISLALLLLSFTFISCRKEGRDREAKSVTLNIELAYSATYHLDLSQYGDDDDIASIKTQATNFVTSDITKGSTGKYQYNYMSAAGPKINAANTDAVEIIITESGSRNRCNESTTVKINFTLK